MMFKISSDYLAYMMCALSFEFLVPEKEDERRKSHGFVVVPSALLPNDKPGGKRGKLSRRGRRPEGEGN